MKKKQHTVPDLIRIIWVFVLLILIVGATASVLKLIAVWPKETFEQKLEGSVIRQSEWFRKNQTDEGDFIYERYAATGEVKEGNNIVRQAGALYGLGQAFAYTKNEDTRLTLEKGLDYFRSLTATVSADRAAITYQDETFTNTTALLVLGLVEYMEADERHRTTENLEYLVRLSNYLISTQTEKGAYINSYVPESQESDYNNGETMYALIRSYTLTQKPEHLSSVKRFADYALSYYGSTDFNNSFFSWGMAGFSYLYRTAPDNRYWEFLAAYADKYFSARGISYEQYIRHQSDGPVAPGTSVFLEGVDHIGWIAKEKDAVMYKKIRRHVRLMLEHLLRYEINSPYGRYTTTAESVSGAVCSQVECETTRIDFLQHNMSAILLYFRFLK